MGNCGSGKEDAPYLAQYYEMVLKKMETPQDVPAMMEILSKPKAEQKAREDKIHAEIEANAKPLLAKSFELHDTKKKGVLDKEDAAVFFSHIMEKTALFQENLGKHKILQNLQRPGGVGEMLANSSPEKRRALEKKITRMLTESMQKTQQLMRKLVIEYQTNKKARDDAAFAVIDIDKNGTVEKEEFMQAVMPTGQNNAAFMKALGFDEGGFDAMMMKAGVSGLNSP